ncbi:MAG: Ku protein [Agrobacterium fabrum]|uniref:Non-homologous end joining protein Ku n=1 Tax=Agrobacterium fabrum TaxID=1176649 RepID=A0A2W5H5N7_9HYPH|nr:MAG: Ku protein [Agrobacterium fabrum]
MARQVFWKGYLKLSLVTAAVSLTPATTEGNKYRFHILNRKTGNRVESRYVDSVTHRAVAARNQVKGFPRGEDDYVLLEDDEIDAVALESTRTIDIRTFVPKGLIDWIWYDRPHFLLPEDKIGTEAFSVIREAMKANDVFGIARLVLYRRERAVLLEPSGKGIILWTLHYGEEVRGSIDALEPKMKIEKPLLEAMEKRIGKQVTGWKPTLVQDPIQKKIKSLLKTKGEAVSSSKNKSGARAKTGGNVINIMDALKKSIASEKRR